jgi:hypothetical protein
MQATITTPAGTANRFTPVLVPQRDALALVK